jgi:hypothetical protein
MSGRDMKFGHLHIPKTAGSSIRTGLFELASGPSSRIQVHGDAFDSIWADLDRYEVVSGHLSLHQIRGLKDRDFLTLCSWRDPAARYRSEYLYHRYRTFSHIEAGDPARYASMHLAKCLQPNEYFDSSLLGITHHDNVYTRLFSEKPHGRLDAKDLELAVRNLAQIDVFLQFENLDMDWADFCEGFAPITPKLGLENTTEALIPESNGCVPMLEFELPQARLEDLSAIDHLLLGHIPGKRVVSLALARAHRKVGLGFSGRSTV